MRYKDGQPDPTIDQIEDAILKAKFESSPTEAFLAKRAQAKATAASIAQSKDERIRLAFLAGHRQGHASGVFVAKVAAYAASVLAIGYAVINLL